MFPSINVVASKANTDDSDLEYTIPFLKDKNQSMFLVCAMVSIDISCYDQKRLQSYDYFQNRF